VTACLRLDNMSLTHTLGIVLDLRQFSYPLALPYFTSLHFVKKTQSPLDTKKRLGR